MISVAAVAKLLLGILFPFSSPQQFPRWLSDKRICLPSSRCGFDPWIKEIHRRRRKWPPLSILLEIPWTGSLGGYIQSMGLQKDRTEQLNKSSADARVRDLLFFCKWSKMASHHHLQAIWFSLQINEVIIALCNLFMQRACCAVCIIFLQFVPLHSRACDSLPN